MKYWLNLLITLVIIAFLVLGVVYWHVVLIILGVILGVIVLRIIYPNQHARKRWSALRSETQEAVSTIFNSLGDETPKYHYLSRYGWEHIVITFKDQEQLNLAKSLGLLNQFEIEITKIYREYYNPKWNSRLGTSWTYEGQTYDYEEKTAAN